MRVLYGEYPPNFKEIDAVFHIADRPGTIFTYGPNVYVPSRIPLTPELYAHEAVHVRQQTDPVAWWERYYVDPAFRLEQELEAHIAEFRKFCERHAGDRNSINRFVVAIAGRLCGPMYGNLLGPGKARSLITKGAGYGR